MHYSANIPHANMANAPSLVTVTPAAWTHVALPQPQAKLGPSHHRPSSGGPVSGWSLWQVGVDVVALPETSRPAEGWLLKYDQSCQYCRGFVCADSRTWPWVLPAP